MTNIKAHLKAGLAMVAFGVAILAAQIDGAEYVVIPLCAAMIYWQLYMIAKND